MGNTESGYGHGEPTEDDRQFLEEAIKEARRGLFEGGLPIGAVLVIDRKIVGKGRNRRVQNGSPILHAEMACLEDAGRLPAADYKRATLYTTLSPCPMCAGAVLLYGIPRVVVADNEHFKGDEIHLMQSGVEVLQLDFPDAKNIVREFIDLHPDLWAEDIGLGTAAALPAPREVRPQLTAGPMAPLPAAPPPALPEPVPALPEPVSMAPPAYAEQPMSYGAEGGGESQFGNEQPMMFGGGGEAPPVQFGYEEAPPQEQGEQLPPGGEGEQEQQFQQFQPQQ